MLQAYALYQTVNKLRHSAFIIQYLDKEEDEALPEENIPFWQQTLMSLFPFGEIFAPKPQPQGGLITVMAKNFVSSHIKNTQFLDLKNPSSYSLNIDQFIVGSDQVWRCIYTRDFGDPSFFFLDFAPTALRQKSFAYAASFGSSQWEGSPEETPKCQALLQDFQAVSVREHSGMTLCQEVFGVDSVQMPDPTLLLQAKDYNKVIRKEQTSLPAHPFIASYILDRTEEPLQLLDAISSHLETPTQHLLPCPASDDPSEDFYCGVGQWLRSFKDSSYVVTDSFHGCIFAIIFNKPFICLGNKNRGSARFDSLLGTFGLQDRLFDNSSPDQLNQILSSNIDWKKVNALLKSERKRGLAFLKQNLSSESQKS